MTVSLALVASLTDAPAGLLVAALVFATAVSMAWNGLSFTLAAELGGRRSGAAIGLQQTVLAASGVGAPVAFAALVSWTVLAGCVLGRSGSPACRLRGSSSPLRRVSRAR